jgi:hypothetical protein
MENPSKNFLAIYIHAGIANLGYSTSTVV